MPDLLARYGGPGGDPYGQAVITAAMDATRLGHASPLPAALLQDAAVGYLTGPQRTRPIATWRDTALDWATEELRGAVRALQPVPPLCRSDIGFWFDLDLLGFQAARSYSLIRPPRTGFRRIWHEPGSAAGTRGAGSGSGTRWPMPWWGRAVL